jgi:SAM-dependent methyltransferase
MLRGSIALAVLLAGCSRDAPSPAPPPRASAAAPPQAVLVSAPSGIVEAGAVAAPDTRDPLEKHAAEEWSEGKHGDVVYVPTPQNVVDKILDVAKPQKGELLYDLGCGDGRIVVAAAKKYGARAVGFDLDPDRVSEARENVRKNGVESLATIKRADVFDLDLSPANVVTIYLLPELNLRLRPQLEKLAPGSRIVTHDFDMGPAKPDGHWTLTGPFFGLSNELYDASAPEDPAHYKQVQHDVFLWRAPIKFPPPR